MGTRALVNVRDEGGSVILCMYSQFDGYPSGLGSDLAKFLKNIKLVNGFTGKEPLPVANGMGCLAAQLVAYFKKEVGQYYLVDPTVEHGEDYIYDITEKKVKVRNYRDEILFDDSWYLFREFCLGSDE